MTRSIGIASSPVQEGVADVFLTLDAPMPTTRASHVLRHYYTCDRRAPQGRPDELVFELVDAGIPSDHTHPTLRAYWKYTRLITRDYLRWAMGRR